LSFKNKNWNVTLRKERFCWNI